MTQVHHLSQVRQAQLVKTDEMSPELRQVVHDYGYPIVYAFVSCGITKPGIIRNLVAECWHGARQSNQSNGGIDTVIDLLLINSGSSMSARTFIRALYDSSLCILPMEPMPQGIDASMVTVSGGTERMTKREKHTRRLRAAIQTSLRHRYPWLFKPMVK
jgi:hypothetical protein